MESVSINFDASLIRLSEIMGALHYLGPLCQSAESGQFRTQIQELLDSDPAFADRRERMTGAFNKGYRGYELTYRACTPSAQAAIRAYLGEGSKILRDLAARFGSN